MIIECRQTISSLVHPHSTRLTFPPTIQRIGASPDGIILPASDPLDLGRAQILAPSPHPSFDPGTAPRLPSGLNANEVLPISAAPRDALQTLPTELDLKMGPGTPRSLIFVFPPPAHLLLPLA